MSKGYWIARIDVHNPESYPDYVEAAKPAFERFRAKILARGGQANAIEGPGRARNVVLEFPSFQAAVDCYNSPEYQLAVKIRQQHADGEIVLVEGV